MRIEKSKCGPQSAVIVKLYNGVKIVQTIFQWCAGKYEGKCWFKGLHVSTRFRFPVLNTLSFVENDKVPFYIFDQIDISAKIFYLVTNIAKNISLSIIGLNTYL